jgi:hypothetical protein
LAKLVDLPYGLFDRSLAAIENGIPLGRGGLTTLIAISLAGEARTLRGFQQSKANS